MGDKNLTEFQAKLLAGPRQNAPVEEHMRNVMRLTGCWFVLSAAVGLVMLWAWDAVPAAIATGMLTPAALAVLRRIATARAGAGSGASTPLAP